MITRAFSPLKSSQIVRYFFVGGISALLDLLIFLFLAKIKGFNYLWVGGLGFILATLLNYVLSIKYVFESKVRFTKRVEIFWIYVVSLVGLFLHLAFLYLFIDLVHMEKMTGKVLAGIAVFLWNYLMRKNFIFK